MFTIPTSHTQNMELETQICKQMGLGDRKKREKIENLERKGVTQQKIKLVRNKMQGKIGGRRENEERTFGYILKYGRLVVKEWGEGPL